MDGDGVDDHLVHVHSQLGLVDADGDGVDDRLDHINITHGEIQMQMLLKGVEEADDMSPAVKKCIRSTVASHMKVAESIIELGDVKKSDPGFTTIKVKYDEAHGGLPADVIDKAAELEQWALSRNGMNLDLRNKLKSSGQKDFLSVFKGIAQKPGTALSAVIKS